MGTVFGKNTTSVSITVAGHKVYYIDSTDAEIVDVQDGNNAKYNAFKYLLSGTPYWYVIDGEHDTWTDDLSAWGYSEVQPVVELPVVSIAGDLGQYNWLRVSHAAESVSGGGNTSNLTIDGTDYPSYNTGTSYAILQWQQSGGTTSGRVEFSIVNANGKIQAHNNTSGTLTFYQARVAVCSSNQATVVTVYNSSNVAYNAFKFTANNTDYYYVLDGTQTDWTDNLSSIGYHLPDIDIDTNFGDAVSIPSGYTVQSVKASRAYAVGVIDYDEWNYFFDMHVPGQDVYCSDTDTNLLGISVDPCIGMFQITTINSQGSYSGYHLSCRSSQTTAIAPSAIENKELNQNGNFISARLSNVANPGALQNCHAAIVSGKPMIIRKYDSSGNLVEYYMNVPQSLWQFQNGVFSWLGDSTSQSDMAYYYKGTGTTAIRIHCVAS